ncbi:MAG: bifunctional precorrin-2 dehydrogenase/sirohydrochlorin ferrochelatase, partial [Chitinophagaceae bacterium]|nr:bifunctional precorrin-2 dehydrogenase/sirohydrochlorin ferrochelatase [Chitinophagaceae bacterium]
MASTSTDTNHLFPVFLKLENLRLLIVGGGYVGMEKLQTVINNSPATKIKLVARLISNEIKELSKNYPNIQLVQKPYAANDLNNIDIVIAAINEKEITTQIVMDANARGILVNAADKPELCDFYLGSIVKKGNLKIAISTNGKSPTIAKRVKEVIHDFIPDEMDQLLMNMQSVRNNIHGNFDDKV